MYRVSVYNGGRSRAKKNKTKLSISAREYVFANGIISIPRTLLYAIAYTKRFSTIMNHYFRRRCLFFFFSNLCTPRIRFSFKLEFYHIYVNYLFDLPNEFVDILKSEIHLGL